MLNNPYGNTVQDPVQTCKIMIEWCSKAIQYTSFLRNGQPLSQARKQALDHWKYVFQQLERQAKDCLGSGHFAYYNPLVLNQLLHRGQHLKHEFARFLQTHPFPKVEPDQNPQTSAEFAEKVYQGTSLRNDIDPKSLVNPVPIGGHTLPPLPYDYNALEPYIDEKTMHLHHDKHHKSYVDGLNKAETMMEKARKSGDFQLITHWEREAAFNGAGHYLHTIFWDNMTPKDGGEPKGTLQQQITKNFGSFSAFKQHFSATAEKAEAVGWAILIWASRSNRLEILQAEKHQNLSQWDVIPLLVLDVWEHAYYLKYNNDRKAYIEAWWNVVNWYNVIERFDKAHKLTWKPY